MKTTTFNKRRFALCAAALILLAILLAGCGPDYAGNGNRFTLHAQIASIGSHSITVSRFEVESAEGKAQGWFTPGSHQIHNNYNTCGWHSRHTVGHVYDVAQQQVSLSDLKPGEWVTIYGRIRSNAHQCGKYQNYNSRPVFDQVFLDRKHG